MAQLCISKNKSTSYLLLYPDGDSILKDSCLTYKSNLLALGITVFFPLYFIFEQHCNKMTKSCKSSYKSGNYTVKELLQKKSSLNC